PARECGDVAAVVNAVAARTGEPVVLFGASWGASCALGAARDLPSLRALVLYEPSLGRRQLPVPSTEWRGGSRRATTRAPLLRWGGRSGSQKSRSRNGGGRPHGSTGVPPP